MYQGLLAGYLLSMILLDEMSELLLGSQRVTSKRKLGADCQFELAELEAALQHVLCD